MARVNDNFCGSKLCFRLEDVNPARYTLCAMLFALCVLWELCERFELQKEQLMEVKEMRRVLNWLLVTIVVLVLVPGFSVGAEKVIKMSTTTSTENSGLLDVLLPEFTKETGIQVKVFAKGTGAAIRDGMDGNMDIIFVHAKNREEKFVDEGYGAYRLAVMHNDFVIIGPASDPAGIKGTTDVTKALRKIATSKAKFISRGDDSGTHTKEQELWQATGLPLKTEATEIIKKGKKNTVSFTHPEGMGEWYFSIGQGMGKTLTFAEEKQAYTMTDRGTYLNYKFGRQQGLDLEILSQGDERLFNPYGIIPISPKKYSHVQFEWADQFAKWLVSPKAQALIAEYRIQGQQAFFPDAIKYAK
jgi:tungstate transport system substrate-binding protein